MKKLLASLTVRIGSLGLLLLAIAMAIATFLENDYGSQATRKWIYEALWFEALIVIVAFIAIVNIIRYRMIQQRKWSSFLFHISFIIIVVGAGITRYFGTEGMVHIREGQTVDFLFTSEPYLQIHIRSTDSNFFRSRHLRLNPAEKPNIKEQINFHNHDINIELNEYIQHAEEGIEKDEENGVDIIEIVLATDGGRVSHFLKEGETQIIGGHQWAFGADTTGKSTQFLITKKSTKDGLKTVFWSKESLNIMTMATGKVDKQEADQEKELIYQSLYSNDHERFVFKGLYPSSALRLRPGKDEKKPDHLVGKLSMGDQSLPLDLTLIINDAPPIQTFNLHGMIMDIALGARIEPIPFGIKLKDFILDRYPGSESPAAYTSEVTVIDKSGEKIDKEISMNNVLDYNGYRFFQASYDPDEKGTILAVNKDWWGMHVTYLGYLLMMFGMTFSFFDSNSRFNDLRKKYKKMAISFIILLLCNIPFALANNQERSSNSFEEIPTIPDVSIAEEFATILVQDLDGRIKPIHTLALEFTRQIHKKQTVKIDSIQLNANQFFIAALSEPAIWKKKKIIAINNKAISKEIKEAIHLRNSEKYVSFQQLLGENNSYLLQERIESINRKRAAERNAEDKELLKLDERFNLFFNLINGQYLKIFPIPDDYDKQWVSPVGQLNKFNKEDSVFVSNIMLFFFQSLKKSNDIGTEIATDSAKGSKTTKEEQPYIDYIKIFQERYGKDVMPSAKAQSLEILYNKLNANFYLFIGYWLLGIILLVAVVIKSFYTSSKPLNYFISFLKGLSLIALAFHLFNTCIRWYFGGHAPWSNGYEMTVFVGLCSVVFGFAFSRHSLFTLPLSLVLAGSLLFVAWLDWLNPEVGTLMPVLNSWWLMVHVAIIVSSYAPLGLSFLLGITVMLIVGITRITKKRESAKQVLNELHSINEISMIIGLFMLSIGTFLGGIWANESWGRYWAWDPKETWALISMLIYAIVLHFRFIPKLRDPLLLNTASTWAFGSIIMTSFGVNYYLSGLHSYAKGDPIPIPPFIYWLVAVILAITIFAWYGRGESRERAMRLF